MINSKRLTIILLIASISFVWSCKIGASDNEVQGAIDGIMGTYKGFFKILLDKKANPDEALKEAEKYSDDNKTKLQEYGKILGKVNPSQYEMIQKFNNNLAGLSRETGQKLGPTFGNKPGAKEKLGSLMEKMGKYYSEAAR